MNQFSTRIGVQIAGAAIFCASTAAQQFTQLTGALPGPNRWSEGVVAADVDLDGDLDLFFANGDGFAGPGQQRQNTLVINQLVENGPNIYTDESVARLGVNLSHAKMAAVGDVNGDGYPDVLFANAFNTDVPFLYINRGAAQPGFFDMESATRGLTEMLNSAGAKFGDLDGDGDLDLVITDAGASLLGGAGAQPKLYLNDGAGFFTDVSGQLNAPTKVAQQDVSLVDVDNDWDLDVLLVNRAANANGTHYLLLNDGTANFTDQSTLVPNTSTSVYEAEAADLDGDLDRDLFFLSLGGFREGHMRNDLEESGSLGFTSGTLQPGNVDDNEVAFLDYDVDGDYDVLVGSLGNRERIYRNDGALTFVDVTGVIQNIGDSTLDVAVADLDGDGDYDFVTAQGESGNFTNRLYLNSGPADTLAPVVVATDVLEDAGTQRLVARVQDQVLDDGDTYVTAKALFARVNPTDVMIDVTASGFVPSSVSVATGTRLIFTDNGSGATTLTEGGTLGWSLALAAGGEVERAMVANVAQVVSAAGVGGTLQIDVTGAPIELDAFKYGGDVYSTVFPALAPGMTGEIAYVYQATDFMGNVGWSPSGIARDVDAPGDSYCTPTLNSSGAQARTVLRGSDVLSMQDLTLEAWALPTNTFGFFLASRTQDVFPVSQGIFCLGQPFGRFSNNIVNSGFAGAAAVPVAFNQLPSGVNFAVGQTWNFTFWFRDVNPTNGANFADGVELRWQ